MNTKFKKARWMTACAALVLLTACGGDDDGEFITGDGTNNSGGVPTDGTGSSGGTGNGGNDGSGGGSGSGGGTQLPLRGVFTLSNETAGNEVIFFRSGEDGTLSEAGRFDTGGTGTGKSIIGSQHPLQITKDNKFLLAVSPKSDELTAFRITEQGLERTDVEGTRGQKPISVTVREDGLVFVLNVNGGEGGITGFRLSDSGQLIPLPGSDRQLTNDPMALPPQVKFSPDGSVLVVTERFAEQQGKIATFTVSPEGQLGEAMEQPPAGMTPFGMMFRNDGVLVVSEAFAQAPGNPIPGEGKASSFRVLPSGALEVISASVPAMGTVTCWVEISNDGRFVWVTNTGSDNITTYALNDDGTLEQLRVTPTDKGPIGMGQSVDGKFLYVENADGNTITAFRIDESDGSLTQFQTVSVPEPAFGMMDFNPVATFATLNANGDTSLSQEEFNAGMQGQGDFADFDTNADNQLTEQEFNTGMENQGGFAGFDDFDTDTSGTLSQQEFSTGMLGGDEEFGRFDTDANSQVTEQEFNAGLERPGDAFSRFDTNTDNFLSQEEFGAGVGSTGAGAFTRFDTNADNRLTEDEFDTGLDNTSGFTGLDANFDGVLDQEERNAGQQQGGNLAQRDTNGDGLISVEEFNAGAQQGEGEGEGEGEGGGGGEEEDFFEDLF